MKLSPTDFIRRRVARITSIALASLLLAIVVTISLRGVSAGTFGKFRVTSESRVGKLIKRIAPGAWKTTVRKSPAAPFATITVTTLTDEVTTNGQCSLREAIANANNNAPTNADCAAGSGADIITLNVSGTFTLTAGEISVTSGITINEGAGDAVISGNNASRIFNVSTANGNLTLNGLTLQDGNATTGGGCIQVSASSNAAVSFNDGILQNCTTANQGGAIGTGGASGTLSITITNSTLQNNTSLVHGGAIGTSGGGIQFITITNSTLQNNSSGSNGGAISQNTGKPSLSVSGSTFTNNRAGVISGSWGGAIVFTNGLDGSVSITNSSFTDNKAQTNSSSTTQGGAIHLTTGVGVTSVISNSTFTNNQALGSTTSNEGGTIYKSGPGLLTLSNDTLTGNSASSNGGAIYINQGSLSALNTAISGSSSSDNGGGIYNVSGATLNLIGSTISGYTATNGGGIWNAGTLALINSTISGNTATSKGGGLYTGNANVTLRNATIANNTAAIGGGISDDGGNTINSGNSIFAGNIASTAPDFSGVVASQGYNLFSSASGITSGLNGTDIINASPGLAGLANNGGTTLTHALMESSPAVNAGSNALAVDTTNGNAALTTDQRGAGFPRTIGGTVDIGAYESTVAPNTPPTISAQTGITRNQGSGSSNSQIATVNDTESGAGGVTITVNGSNTATVNGITLNGIVNSSGTVTADIAAMCGASNASFTLTATDSNGATATATLNVTVTGISVAPTILVNGLTSVSYTAALSATGGTGSYNFSLVSGALPPGLILNGNVLSGTPTTAGASTFTIRASDTSNACFGERTYTINIGSTGLMYYPLARPIRLLDTRPGASPNACSQPNAQIAQGTPFTQIARGTCDGLTIPANATTLTGNVTVVQPAGNGFLTLYPSDAPQPSVANSNFLAGEVLNNAFTVGLSVNNGAFNIFVNSTSHVVIDVTGYYAPPASGGLYFHPLPKPIRLLDTRSGSGVTGCQTPGVALQEMSTRTQTGVLTCDGVTIPTDALALVGNATTTNSASSGYLTLYPANAAQPFAASSNFAAGVNRNAPFTVGLSPSGEFNIYTARTTDLVIDVMGYYSAQSNDTNGQGLLFNSLGAPLRLLDTRAAGATGCYTPGAKMTGQTVYTQETQIPCTNLTSSARGLVGNVSALNAEGNGFVTFWPSNAIQPNVATSNYQTNRVFNRHFTVGLGPDAAFKRYVLSTTDLIIDISGFFAP